METIITLLLILIPLVFKAIGKKLEQASTMQKTTLEDPDPVQTPSPQREYPLKVTPLKQQQKAAAPRLKPTAPVQAPQQQTRKEKIDPRKLIIYSEIMKPKHTD